MVLIENRSSNQRLIFFQTAVPFITIRDIKLRATEARGRTTSQSGRSGCGIAVPYKSACSNLLRSSRQAKDKSRRVRGLWPPVVYAACRSRQSRAFKGVFSPHGAELSMLLLSNCGTFVLISQDGHAKLALVQYIEQGSHFIKKARDNTRKHA